MIFFNFLIIVNIIFSDSSSSEYKLKKEDYIINAISGTIGGIAGGLGVSYLSANIMKPYLKDDEFLVELSLLSGYVLGIPLGMYYFIYSVSEARNKKTGPFSGVFKGTGKGTAISFGIFFFSTRFHFPRYTEWIITLSIPIPIVTGILEYNNSFKK